MSSLVRLLAVAVLSAVPAAQAHAERLFGLTSLGAIVTFDTDAANVIISSGLITGVGAGETLIGLDLRPSDRTLYSVSSAGTIYTIAGNARGYLATAVGTLATTLTGANYGVDFNPVPDRLRIVSNSNQNLRINPNGGATAVDTAVGYPASPTTDPNIIGVAYTNNRAGATTTTLYGIDARTDSLVKFIAPNAGTQLNVGALGFTVGNSARLGFDISGGTGDAFVARNDRLYALNLLTGRATNLGLIGGIAGPAIIGITAASVPEPASWALMIGGFGLVGAAMRRRVALVS